MDEHEIWQVVADEDIAWHCGTLGAYVHPHCRNGNSIGIEMCCKKDSGGNWYFEPQTVESTLWLVRSLMARYKVAQSNILRHYDVTGKICPAPYVRDVQGWNQFKAALALPSVSTCVSELFHRGILSNQALWNEKAAQDEDIAWLLAKYNPYVTANGGSVKSPLSVAGTEAAIGILRKQGILSDVEKWQAKSAQDEDMLWLLIKLADYIN